MSLRPSRPQSRPLGIGAVTLSIACLATLSLSAGCSTFDPLEVRTLGKPPIRVGVTRYDLNPTMLYLPEWSLLNDHLAAYLGEPVAFQLMTPMQIGVHLGTGRLQFAMLGPADYCETLRYGNPRLLVSPVDSRGRTQRRGLIVVSAKSPIESVAELEGKRFHFMPSSDMLNQAALGMLHDAGIAEAAIDHGVLGLELDTHHISSAEVVKSVVIEGDGAGVIDEADYDAWAETGGIVLSPLPIPSKDQIRVIARTVPVPYDGIFVSIRLPSLS